MLTFEDCRAEVKAFAVLMEKRLRANDHKGGWKHEDPTWLVSRIEGEYEELRDLTPNGSAIEIGLEAADVANFAMMVADVCDGLQPEEEE